jgi:hypothetical protein
VGSRKHNSNINRRLKGKIKAVIMDENGTCSYDILYDGDEADDLTREFEYPMYKKSNLGPRASEKKQREFMTKQEARLLKLKKANLALDAKKEEEKTLETTFKAMVKRREEFGPITAANWKVYADAVTKPGLDYVRTRFLDLDAVVSGHGATAINYGLKAVRAFHGASVFDPTYGRLKLLFCSFVCILP